MAEWQRQLKSSMRILFMEIGCTHWWNIPSRESFFVRLLIFILHLTFGFTSWWSNRLKQRWQPLQYKIFPSWIFWTNYCSIDLWWGIQYNNCQVCLSNWFFGDHLFWNLVWPMMSSIWEIGTAYLKRKVMLLFRLGMLSCGLGLIMLALYVPKLWHLTNTSRFISIGDQCYYPIQWVLTQDFIHVHVITRGMKIPNWLRFGIIGQLLMVVLLH